MRSRISALLALAPALLAGCATIPPAPAPVRAATQVKASFDQTWAAAIDHFAEGNVPIATIDKASGLIATPELRVGPEESLKYADCGGTKAMGPYVATQAMYNILVRGDSARSTVKVTASWSGGPIPCNTKGAWETETEAAIKARAEGAGSR